MIEYSHGRWGMFVLLKCRGSVIPKSLLWSVPCALATVLMHLYWGEEKGDSNRELEGIESIWSGYTFVLGFLIVFRSNQAYSRFWESVSLFYTSSGEWLSAFSNLMCFCSRDAAKEAEVERFRQYVMRLLSLLHCTALQGMCELRDDSMEVLDVGGINKDSLRHLQGSPDRCETVLLWIERLVMEADKEGVLEASQPILSRAFQELSRGMVGVTNLRKIRDVPFPFPYTQYLSCMLIAHWLLTPVIASQMVLQPWWAACVVFVVSTSYWTLFYIAQEIDQPFGEDPNDLPVVEMQSHFNVKLKHLCNPLSYTVPGFEAESDLKVTRLSSRLSVFGLNRLNAQLPIQIPEAAEEDAAALDASVSDLRKVCEGLRQGLRPGQSSERTSELFQQLRLMAPSFQEPEIKQLLQEMDVWSGSSQSRTGGASEWQAHSWDPTRESERDTPRTLQAPQATPRQIARALETTLAWRGSSDIPQNVLKRMQLLSKQLSANVICEDSV
ncbi:unnamed protein product [Symbiodinium microadriaticum]|nr:unnamed protein product [Symbiodinium sp. KB8]CAE7909291.1 unnamed protein product [Symbiodinium microadriaticum]